MRPFDDLTASRDEPKSARSEHRTVLDAADRDAFLAALENPPPPSDKLREALRLEKGVILLFSCQS